MSFRNPRTYLDLVQRTCVECGVASSQSIETVLPSIDSVSLSGSMGRVINWVGDAWGDLQTSHDDWDWMRSSNILGAGVSFPTIAGQPNYPIGTGAGTVQVAVDDFGKWDVETFRNYTTATSYLDEITMADVPFDYWRNVYMLGSQRNVQTRPWVCAVGPNQSLNLGPPPNANYTITADYFMAPSVMEVDADTPTGLPVRFNMLIVYFAMKKYAGYEAATEVYTRASEEAAPMYAQLQAVRAPKISWSGALA